MCVCVCVCVCVTLCSCVLGCVCVCACVCITVVAKKHIERFCGVENDVSQKLSYFGANMLKTRNTTLAITLAGDVVAILVDALQ